MCFFIIDVSLNATNSSFQKSITFCRSIFVKNDVKLVEFLFEHTRTS